LVKAHGGKIWVEPVERGACVAFTIPVTVQPRTSRGNTVKRKT